MPEKYDVAIVGAGPTGLAAAVYTSREDLKTVVIDKAIAGGLIATTEVVDNYPGFPEGIGGMQLAMQMQQQAERFGTEVKTGIEAVGIQKDGAELKILTKDEPISTKSIIIATGSSYRKLDVPGEKELEGKGVHYCATCDGPLYRGKTVVAIGGGNSALQEGLFLTKFVEKLVVLVRGAQFKGAEVLADSLTSKTNVEVHFETTVSEIISKDGKVAGVVADHKGSRQEIQADGIFPFIGLLPNSGWLNGDVEMDDRGFIKVDKSFCTNIPGVFAAGDIVEGSIGQVASAVGEGVSAALSIRAYLEEHSVTTS